MLSLLLIKLLALTTKEDLTIFILKHAGETSCDIPYSTEEAKGLKISILKEKPPNKPRKYYKKKRRSTKSNFSNFFLFLTCKTTTFFVQTKNYYCYHK